MPGILGRGNVEMYQKIQTEGPGLLIDMYEARTQNVIELYRVCSLQEAIDTWFYCLVGGRYRALERVQPTEEEAVDQVGNNEGMPFGGNLGRQKEIEKLRAMGVKIETSVKEPTVKEFSHRPAMQFKHGGNTVIRVGVNQEYCVRGSGLSFEGGGGVVIQIGTPLAWVEIDEAVTSQAFPNRYGF